MAILLNNSPFIWVYWFRVILEKYQCIGVVSYGTLYLEILGEQYQF